MADYGGDANVVNSPRERLTEDIRKRQERGPFEITASQLAIANECETADSELTLEDLAAAGELEKLFQTVCPCERAERIGPDVGAVCTECDRAFGTDVPGLPIHRVAYRHQGVRTRDVRWMVALHGMNTHGAWQEEFMWRVSRTYGYSVPVAIYKYGRVRPGAVLKFRQRALTRGLITKMRALEGDAHETGFPGPPDVIAHSLGTWLLGHALREEPKLKVGRVILTGCILRPDFEWRALIERGQVEAVLCHYSAQDFWAGVTQYVIPDSGPSGRIGFRDRQAVVHSMEPDFSHGDYFEPAHIGRNFDLLWAPFLTRRDGRTKSLSDHGEAPEWRQSNWLVRANLFRLALLGSAACLAAFIVAVFVIGAYTMLRL